MITPGTGKTHLAIGLAVRACQAGHRVAFATASEWVDRLAAAHHGGHLQAELTKLSRGLHDVQALLDLPMEVAQPQVAGHEDGLLRTADLQHRRMGRAGTLQVKRRMIASVDAFRIRPRWRT
ncbi:ATP-binding protein [Streptomyces canus]|uniref:ATP-binding protein n=1 Tax=Streptomyces canus TaxID=58343 RepID=UPI0027854E81|nr:ATP-binding protein [Streptomyces canus]MDQ0765433.1 hypothetical protein [Streptomyces canus]